MSFFLKKSHLSLLFTARHKNTFSSKPSLPQLHSNKPVWFRWPLETAYCLWYKVHHTKAFIKKRELCHCAPSSNSNSELDGPISRKFTTLKVKHSYCRSKQRQFGLAVMASNRKSVRKQPFFLFQKQTKTNRGSILEMLALMKNRPRSVMP